MGPASANRSEGCGRLVREKEYWNRVYQGASFTGLSCSWMKYVADTTYIAQFFQGLLKPLRRKRILSLGGGVDTLGVSLARDGHRVVCVDISTVASELTRRLAEQDGVADHVTTVTAGCEEMAFPSKTYDVVLCKRSLHHMDVAKVVAGIHAALVPGGTFLAEEPVCLHRLVRWVHRRFPFYGDAPHTPDERELIHQDLATIQRTFGRTQFYFFDLLARESLAYFLRKKRWHGLLRLLGRLDHCLVNRLFPPLRHLSNYVVVHAVK
jgi:SAM-dependent methyltransferase